MGSEIACVTALRPAFATAPSKPLHLNWESSSLSSKSFGVCKAKIASRGFQVAVKRTELCCCHKETAAASSEDEQEGPPQEAVLKAISGLSLSSLAFLQSKFNFETLMGFSHFFLFFPKREHL